MNAPPRKLVVTLGGPPESVQDRAGQVLGRREAEQDLDVLVEAVKSAVTLSAPEGGVPCPTPSICLIVG